MTKIKSVVLFILILCFKHSFAYEIATHGSISNQAFYRSVLSNGQLIQQLGISYGDSPFGINYFDVSGGVVNIRARKSYEKRIIEDMLGLKGQSLTIQGWLMRGAIREDDIPDYLFGENPQDDPYGKIVRVRNHFYDPFNHRPLTVLGAALGKDAPTWASGVENAFGCPNCQDLNRRNHFTVLDARIAQWRALTGQDSNGNAGIGPNGQQADESVRKAYWATLFRSLGDVVHLVQDMGQPQHCPDRTSIPCAHRGLQI